MPPALSDEENGVSSGEEEIPPRGKGKAPKEAEDEEEQSGDEEGSYGDDDEFVVEKILSHKVVNGEAHYRVKWLGYEKKSDQTWEPESNLDGVEALQDYWDLIGGRPEVTKGKKRKGRASAFDSETATPTSSSSKRTKKEKEWSPPPGSWEHDVDYVETVEESIDNATGRPARYAYLVWNNQKKSQHPLHHVYTKCPQKMLQYYESHLVFTPSDPNDVLNGDDKEVIISEVTFNSASTKNSAS